MSCGSWLEDSPSLAQRVPEAISIEWPVARELAFDEAPLAGVEDLAHARDQVLGPWLPD